MNACRLWLIPILLAAGGCEWRTTSRVGVQVMVPVQRPSGDGTHDAPAGGAVVGVKCPSGVVESLGSTDAAGWVLVTSKAPVGLDCDLAIDYRGHPSALVPVNQTCSRKEGGECRELELRLTLDFKGKGDSANAESVALRARCEEEPHGGFMGCRGATKPLVTEWRSPSSLIRYRSTNPSPR